LRWPRPRSGNSPGQFETVTVSIRLCDAVLAFPERSSAPPKVLHRQTALNGLAASTGLTAA